MPEPSSHSLIRDTDLQQAAFFRACMATANQCLSVPPPQTEPVLREWRPDTIAAGAVAAEIVKRHPEFRFGFEAAPCTKIRQAMRGASRGRFGKFSSRKMGRNIRAQSDLEFDCIRWMEFDPNVEAYLEQPVVLRYPANGSWRRHIPDLFVRSVDGDGFIEVKPEKIAALPENEEKYAAIGVAVAALGYTYRVLTERQIRRNPAFNTLSTLFLRNRWTPLPDDESCQAIQHLLGGGEVALSKVSVQLPDISDDQVRALVLRGFLSIDLNTPLGPQSQIRISGRPPLRANGGEK